MRRQFFVIALLIGSPAVAADGEQSPAPSEEQHSASPSPYAELNKQVQEKLRAESFYNGPINGDFGYYTQAALAQFQLSRALPASGSLDETTLAALGLEQEAERAADAGEQSASGASAPASPD